MSVQTHYFIETIPLTFLLWFYIIWLIWTVLRKYIFLKGHELKRNAFSSIFLVHNHHSHGLWKHIVSLFLLKFQWRTMFVYIRIFFSWADFRNYIYEIGNRKSVYLFKIYSFCKLSMNIVYVTGYYLYTFGSSILSLATFYWHSLKSEPETLRPGTLRPGDSQNREPWDEGTWNPAPWDPGPWSWNPRTWDLRSWVPKSWDQDLENWT